MAGAVAVTWTDLDAAGLRRAVGRSRNGSAAHRMLALARVLEGASRTEAARTAGMDRQTLRDWVHRYNAEGLAGLLDRPGERGPSRASRQSRRQRWPSWFGRAQT